MKVLPMTIEPVMVAAACIGILGGGFALNEWSHGGVSGMVGLGHHHMLDYRGIHCADHADPNLGPRHVDHMHDANQSQPHPACPGGPGMHGMHPAQRGV